MDMQSKKVKPMMTFGKDKQLSVMEKKEGREHTAGYIFCI